MDFALPVAHLEIDRAVGPRLIEYRQSLVEPAIVGQGEGILPQQGRIARRQRARLGRQPHPARHVSAAGGEVGIQDR